MILANSVCYGESLHLTAGCIQTYWKNADEMYARFIYARKCLLNMFL